MTHLLLLRQQTHVHVHQHKLLIIQLFRRLVKTVQHRVLTVQLQLDVLLVNQAI
jgi:hypothetical protein